MIKVNKRSPIVFKLILILTVCAWCGCDGGLPVPPGATAAVSMAPIYGPAPLQVHFRGDTNTIWDLGDGTAKRGPEAYHDYTIPGTYRVSYVERDDDGVLHTREREIEVVPKFREGVLPESSAERFAFPIREHAMDGNGSRPHIADVNGDGQLDLVTNFSRQGPNTSTLQVYLGAGDASFSYPVLSEMAGISRDLVAVSLDADMKSDIVLSGDSVRFLRGLDDGHVELVSEISVPGASLIEADFINADDFPDFVIQTGDSIASVILSNGSYDYEHVTSVEFRFDLGIYELSVEEFALGDVDGDEHTDAVFLLTQHDGLSISIVSRLYYGDGLGGFIEGPEFLVDGGSAYDLALADVSGDSLLDIVIGHFSSRRMYCLLNSDSGTFTRVITTDLTMPLSSIDDWDIDGDGLQDVVGFDQAFAEMAVFTSVGDGTFSEGPISNLGFDPSQHVLASFDGDDSPEVCYTHRGMLAVTDLGETGEIVGVESVALGNSTNLRSADFDNDGNLDLVASNWIAAGDVGGLYFLFGGENGTFEPLQEFREEVGFVNPKELTTGYVNDDAIIDLVTADKDNLQVLLGMPGRTYDVVELPPTGEFPSGLTIAHLNNDTNADIAYVVQSTETLVILPGQGNGTFSAAQSFATGKRPIGIAVADFDNDGHNDVAVRRDFSNDIVLRFGTPGGPGTEIVELTTGSGVSEGTVLTPDLNGDGKADLLYICSGGTETMLNIDGRTFEPARRLEGTRSPQDLAYEDVNGDGLKDIVSLGLWAVFVSYRSLSGEFEPAIAYGGGYGAGDSMIVRDFNKDSRVDIAALRFDDLEILYQN